MSNKISLCRNCQGDRCAADWRLARFVRHCGVPSAMHEARKCHNLLLAAAARMAAGIMMAPAAVPFASAPVRLHHLPHFATSPSPHLTSHFPIAAAITIAPAAILLAFAPSRSIAKRSCRCIR